MYTVAFWLIIIGFIILVIAAIVYAVTRNFNATIWILLGLGIFIFLIGLIWWLVTATPARVNQSCVRPIRTCAPPLNTCAPPLNTCAPPINTCAPPINPCAPPMNVCAPPMNVCAPPMNTCAPQVNTCMPLMVGGCEGPRVVTNRCGVADQSLTCGLDYNKNLPYKVNQGFCM